MDDERRNVEPITNPINHNDQPSNQREENEEPQRQHAANDDTHDPDEKNDEDNENDDSAVDGDSDTVRRQAVAAAARNRLLLKDKNHRPSPKSPKSTSVGPRRVGSASKARTGGASSTSRLHQAIQRQAAAAAKAVNENTKNDDQKENNSNTPTMSSLTTDSKLRLEPSKVMSTISSFWMPQPSQPTAGDPELIVESPPRPGMGLLGMPEPINHEQIMATSHRLLKTPLPGTVLTPSPTTYPKWESVAERIQASQIPPTQSRPTAPQQQQQHQVQSSSYLDNLNALHRQNIEIRLATIADDADIADLRLSVFSNFSPEIRSQFCARSQQVLAHRRLQGATCLVARNRHQGLVGSAEVSIHEFYGTALGKQRPKDSVLYVTEVAVAPDYRNCGIGSKLMEAVDKLANIRQVETLYLHVDITNGAALRLYEKLGYTRTDASLLMHEEFTRSLNLHDGAMRGRNHYLLKKDLVDTPTWFAQQTQQQQQQPVVVAASSTVTTSSSEAVVVNTNSFGFDVPV